MNKKLSKKDLKTWKDFVEGKGKLYNKDIIYEEAKYKKKDSTIDLHGFTLEEANKKIQNFILKAFDDKVSKLIIVTGKGIHSDVEKNPYVSKDLSILKYSVPEFISNNQNLMKIIHEMQDAKIEDGGAGAFYILLKKNKSIK